jgi:hypothetical protein
LGGLIVAPARIAWRLAAVTDVLVEAPHAKTLVLDVPGRLGHVVGQHVEASAPEHDRCRGPAPLMPLNRKRPAGEYWMQGGAG